MAKINYISYTLTFAIAFAFILCLTSVSAYDTKEVNQNLSFSITSNNASSCTITTLETLSNLRTLNYAMAKNGQTFSATITKGNLTETGDACFNIECSNGVDMTTGQQCYTITPNGYEASIGSAGFYVGLLSMLVVFLVGCVILFINYDNLLAKVGFLGLGYLLLIAITFIAWNMANDFLASASFITDMFRILLFVLMAGLFPLLIGAFAYYTIMLFKIKEIERLMTKGFSSEDAQRRVNRR